MLIGLKKKKWSRSLEAMQDKDSAHGESNTIEQQYNI